MPRKFGLNGLPLPSTLSERDRNKIGYDIHNNLKILKGRNLTWQNVDKFDAQELLKPLSQSKIVSFNSILNKTLHNDAAVRFTLWAALKASQPSKVRFI